MQETAAAAKMFSESSCRHWVSIYLLLFAEAQLLLTSIVTRYKQSQEISAKHLVMCDHNSGSFRLG